MGHLSGPTMKCSERSMPRKCVTTLNTTTVATTSSTTSAMEVVRGVFMKARRVSERGEISASLRGIQQCGPAFAGEGAAVGIGEPESGFATLGAFRGIVRQGSDFCGECAHL